MNAELNRFEHFKPYIGRKTVNLKYSSGIKNWVVQFLVKYNGWTFYILCGGKD